MIIDEEILHAINVHAWELKIPEGSTLDARALLAAITCPETDWGRRRKAGLFEPAYYRGGKFYRDHVKNLVHEYESLASCSYGPWQILYVAAWETGFRGHPWELIDPETCLKAGIRLMNKRCFNTWTTASDPRLEPPASTPQQVFDFWNSGSWRDRFKPEGYIAKAMDGYAEALEFYKGGGGDDG
jgi:hypothetical protein